MASDKPYTYVESHGSDIRTLFLSLVATLYRTFTGPRLLVQWLESIIYLH